MDMRKDEFRIEAERLSARYKSATHYVLAAFALPYSEANLKLSFSPRHFFADLSKLDYATRKRKFTQGTLRTTYHRAVKSGLLEVQDGVPRLTKKGQKKLNYFQPSRFKKGARLLAVFDIPERERRKRDKLRLILKEFKFSQIQKSVWETKYDCREYLEMAIKEDGLQDSVILFEAARIQR